MSTALRLILDNRIEIPLFLSRQVIDGASWTKPLPEELVHGTADDGYGVASTDAAFECNFVYVSDGTHMLGVTIKVSEAGMVRIDTSQSPPAQVKGESQKHGDTWIVTVIYSDSWQ